MDLKKLSVGIIVIGIIVLAYGVGQYYENQQATSAYRGMRVQSTEGQTAVVVGILMIIFGFIMKASIKKDEEKEGNNQKDDSKD